VRHFQAHRFEGGNAPAQHVGEAVVPHETVRRGAVQQHAHPVDLPDDVVCHADVHQAVAAANGRLLVFFKLQVLHPHVAGTGGQPNAVGMQRSFHAGGLGIGSRGKLYPQAAPFPVPFARRIQHLGQAFQVKAVPLPEVIHPGAPCRVRSVKLFSMS
jgi:hypothetical protein